MHRKAETLGKSQTVIGKIKSYLMISISFRFDLPKKNKILLFDEMHGWALKAIIKKDFGILHIRKKQIYFWIYIRQIFLFDFSFKTYCKNYIKFTSPKVIITFNDARFLMYELKSSFENIYFITVMNGLRDKRFFAIHKKHQLKNFKCDYFFVLNKHYIPKFQKLINSEFHTLGNIRNNMVKVEKTKFHNQFLLISQVHSSVKGVNYVQENFHKKLLNFINLYLSNSNKKLHVLLRRAKDSSSLQDEINFYKKISKSNFIFHTGPSLAEGTLWKKKYKIMDKFENIIFTHSTMGYEAVARKKKVAIFAPNRLHNNKYYFGWPAPKQKKNDFFSTQNFTYNEVSRVLKNVNNCTQNNWNKKHYSAIKDQLYLDKNNKKVRDLILKLLNK